ncbi:nuclear receptor coactivator 4-like [Centroberyx affinis]|uniref:nuclear receptor coactivator 4-like n=1 Tax=Centroberyx affinis TaxID=166261 RepID=UPI003A5BC765
MERLSSLNLTPEETPEMSFHGDTRSLRQAITSFGSISTQHVEGVASQSPAPGPAHQRAWLQSCPVVAKKQKTECGALSGWLLGSRPAGSAPIGYQSSKNPQDWLMARREGQASRPVLASFDFLKAWGQLKDLEAWLLKDKTPVIRERANSSSSSSSSSFSIEKIDESEFTMEEEDMEEGRDEEDDELSDWLITPATGATETESDADQWRRVLKPFRESWAPGDWLPAAGRPAADCQTCCQTGPPLEIENLGKLMCLKTPPPSSPASSPASNPASSPAPTTASSPTPGPGPASPPAPHAPPASPLEAWLQQAPLRLQAACRANEPCSSFLQCVCEENCGREALSAWLLQQDGRDKNGVPVAKTAKNTPPVSKTTPPTSKNTPPTLHHRDQEQKVQAILEAWLHPSKPSSSSSPSSSSPSSSCRSPVQVVALSSLSGWVAPEEEKASREEHSSHFKPSSSSSSSPFQAPLDPERWVVPLPEKNSSSSGSGGQPRPPPEEDKWLLRKRSQAQERLVLPAVCDLFSCMKVGGDKDKWLHSAPIQM